MEYDRYKHVDSDPKPERAPVTTFRFVDGFAPMYLARFAAPGHLVVVELPWIQALKKLPDPVFRSRFGV
jgi:hypothetical protein